MAAQGKLHIYTGDGKGKTTAAIGAMIRFVGAGGKAMFIQFLKSSDSSEIAAFQELDGITIMPNPWNYGFTWDMSDQEKEEARGMYSQYIDMVTFRTLQGQYGMLVLDEALTAISTGIVDEQQIVDILDQLPDEMEVILTGTDPSQAMLDRADYVTEMKKIKHPFDKGLRARKGIEY